MPSTYSPDLRIELIANGEKSGTWGTITNLNLGTIIEDSIAGVATVTTASAAQALSVNNGSEDQARCSTLVLNTAAGTNYSVYVPPVPKLYVVRNASASYTCTLYASTVAGNTTAAGSGITVPISTSMLVRCDGTNIVDQTNYISGGLTVGGTMTLSANPASALQAATKQYVDSAASGSFPSGGIIMWSGSVASIPAGWLLCNGSSGTPDLRNRFVVGAGSTYAVDATGGSADATLVSHNHSASSSSSVSDPGHNHQVRENTFLQNSGSGFATGTQQQNRFVTSESNTTGISVSTSTSISSTGSSATNANLPPYYALAYIMKS